MAAGWLPIALPGIVLQPQVAASGRLLHQLLPAPAPLDRRCRRPPGRQVLPLLLLGVTTVFGDPAPGQFVAARVFFASSSRDEHGTAIVVARGGCLEEEGRGVGARNSVRHAHLG